MAETPSKKYAKKLQQPPAWFDPERAIEEVNNQKLQDKLLAELDKFNAVTDAITITGKNSVIDGDEINFSGLTYGMVTGMLVAMFGGGNIGLGISLGVTFGSIMQYMAESGAASASSEKAQNAMDHAIDMRSKQFRRSVWRQLPASQRTSIRANNPEPAK